MKNIFTLLILFTSVFSFGQFSFDTYGVTVLCPEASVGATGTLNDKVYTAVDRNMLAQKVNAEEDLAVCVHHLSLIWKTYLATRILMITSAPGILLL